MSHLVIKNTHTQEDTTKNREPRAARRPDQCATGAAGRNVTDSCSGWQSVVWGEGQPTGENTLVTGFGLSDAHTFPGHTFFSNHGSCMLCMLLRENSSGFQHSQATTAVLPWGPMVLPQLLGAITKQRWSPSGGKALLPQTGCCWQDIKECSVTSDCFQKGIKNEGLSPAGKTGSYSFCKGRSPFLTLNKCHGLRWCCGRTASAQAQGATRTGLPAPVSDLRGVDVHQTHRSWSPRTFRNEAKLNMGRWIWFHTLLK